MIYSSNDPEPFTGEKRCVILGSYMLEQQTTVRDTARHFGISKSTVHKDLTEKLPHADRELFREVKWLLDKNKSERHMRGGLATKRKYAFKKQ